MPPVTFSYFEAPDVPELDLNQTIRSVTQLTLPYGNQQAETVVQYLGYAQGGRFERYSVEHQVERKVEAIIRQERTKRFLEVHRFYAFYLRAKGYFLVQAGKRDSRGMFDRLKEATPPIIASTGTVDLARLLDLGKTTGGWFGKLKIEDVNTAALFGPTGVIDSEDWERYAESGVLASIYMHVMTPDGEPRSIQLTRDRIVVLAVDDGEESNLEFVSHLQSAIEDELTKPTG